MIYNTLSEKKSIFAIKSMRTLGILSLVAITGVLVYVVAKNAMNGGTKQATLETKLNREINFLRIA